ncbi:MAG: hypothetical protein V3V27_01615 [Candidatus Thermoplasmatota archaeon]
MRQREDLLEKIALFIQNIRDEHASTPVESILHDVALAISAGDEQKFSRITRAYSDETLNDFVKEINIETIGEC